MGSGLAGELSQSNSSSSSDSSISALASSRSQTAAVRGSTSIGPRSSWVRSANQSGAKSSLTGWVLAGLPGGAGCLLSSEAANQSMAAASSSSPKRSANSISFSGWCWMPAVAKAISGWGSSSAAICSPANQSDWWVVEETAVSFSVISSSRKPDSADFLASGSASSNEGSSPVNPSSHWYRSSSPASASVCGVTAVPETQPTGSSYSRGSKSAPK